MKLLVCMLVLLWQLPSGVRGTGGIMGTVVSLVDDFYGNLTTVCALESGTLVPFCMGALLTGTPTAQAMWALTAGESFICGLKYYSHTPICWGKYNLVTSIPIAYTSTSYSSINAGRDHVCAVRDNSSRSPGTVDCWGDNTFSQLMAPANVPMLSVSLGDYYSCGISLASKKVLCWGAVGTIDMPSPPSNGKFKAIFAARFHVCGIRLDGYTECWSGLSSMYSNPYPFSIFTSMAGTYYYTCAIEQPNHQMICWSPLNILPTPLPYAISSLSASASINSSSNGTTEEHNGFICGVKEDLEVGNLYCFGTSTHSLGNSLSSFSASKGICRDQCPEGQYPVLTDGQCPNPKHKVCLDCKGECPLDPVPPPSVPLSSVNISNSSSPSITAPVPSSAKTIPSSTSPLSKLAVQVSIAVGCVVLLIAILMAFLIVGYKYGMFRGEQSRHDGSGLIIFSPRQLREATENYNKDIILGTGGFGVVYKGILKNHQIVAIKKPHGTQQSGGDYQVEFDMLTKLDHRCLIKLIGYCQENQALVFPFMEHGSLKDLMADPLTRETVLDTTMRLKIALEVAEGLDYMHQSNVIHRDVKAANILLDASWNAHIADFGISRGCLQDDKTQITRMIVGTPGYLDPTFERCGEFTSRSDVYSFGVLLLELGCGLPPFGLADRVSSLHAQGRLYELVDPNMLRREKQCRLNLLRIAISCVRDDRNDRPSMHEVVTELQRVQRMTMPGTQAQPPYGNLRTDL